MAAAVWLPQLAAAGPLRGCAAAATAPGPYRRSIVDSGGGTGRGRPARGWVCWVGGRGLCTCGRAPLPFPALLSPLVGQWPPVVRGTNVWGEEAAAGVGIPHTTAITAPRGRGRGHVVESVVGVVAAATVPPRLGHRRGGGRGGPRPHGRAPCKGWLRWPPVRGWRPVVGHRGLAGMPRARCRSLPINEGVRRECQSKRGRTCCRH